MVMAVLPIQAANSQALDQALIKYEQQLKRNKRPQLGFN
jgi:hypothetical protein